jgi:hypothetical protein
MASGVQFHHKDVDLLVWEDEEDSAVNPWHDKKSLSLSVGWHGITDDYAEYDGMKSVESESGYDDDDGDSRNVRRCRAVRVWLKADADCIR